MNYLCSCDPCICAADSADRTTSSSGQVMHRPPGSPTAKDGSRLRRLHNTRGSAQRRAALCALAGVALEPPIGAHLITTRRGYTHHGIYAGHGSVLHYAGLARNFRPGPVEEVPLGRFANGRPE